MKNYRAFVFLLGLVAIFISAQFSPGQFNPGQPPTPGGPGGPPITYNPAQFQTNYTTNAGSISGQINLIGGGGGSSFFNQGQFFTNEEGQVSFIDGFEATNYNENGVLTFPAGEEEIQNSDGGLSILGSYASFDEFVPGDYQGSAIALQMWVTNLLNFGANEEFGIQPYDAEGAGSTLHFQNNSSAQFAFDNFLGDFGGGILAASFRTRMVGLNFDATTVQPNMAFNATTNFQSLSFSFLGPRNLSNGFFNQTYCIVSNTSVTPIVATAASGWKGAGTWTITNFGVFWIYCAPGMFSNCTEVIAQ